MRLARLVDVGVGAEGEVLFGGVGLTGATEALVVVDAGVAREFGRGLQEGVVHAPVLLMVAEKRHAIGIFSGWRLRIAPEVGIRRLLKSVTVLQEDLKRIIQFVFVAKDDVFEILVVF